MRTEKETYVWDGAAGSYAEETPLTQDSIEPGEEPFYLPDADEEKVNELREVALKTMGYLFDSIRLLVQYECSEITFKCAFDCWMLALGKGEIIGAHSAAELAVRHFGDKKKKANITKCIKKFQTCMGIPPMPGQRSGAARNHMAQARKEQLK